MFWEFRTAVRGRSSEETECSKNIEILKKLFNDVILQCYNLIFENFEIA